MTDADTLLNAYLRQEYQIFPYQARILAALYTARRPLNCAELAARAGHAELSMKAGLHGIRQALGEDCLIPDPATCRAGIGRMVSYLLAPHAREEINTALNTAIAELSARIAPKLAIAA